MRNNLGPLVLKGAIGFAIGLAVWGGLSAPYTRFLAACTGSVARLSEHPAITQITADGTTMIVDRMDIPVSRSSPRFGVESTDLTFNFVFLITLFAASPRTFADRNVAGFTLAAVALVFVHVAAALSFVEAYYASSFGAWSESHYGYIAQHFWLAAPYFYSVVGVYGSAFALWWLFRPPSVASQSLPAPRSRRASHAARAGNG